ncbi:MAG: dTDP-4-dehydrorhamnose reductase [Chloroflexi bacterium]|nr:dTDP-4-dehydrorhamnose reductase [Chloroflexota bacterium]
MRIAIVGGRGQLGRVLAQTLGAQHQVLILDLPECDITQRSEIDCIADRAPDLVIHAAAMTDVDACARDPRAAFVANALGTQNVALACQRVRAPMVYISTNEVFDGAKDSPYLELDEPHAINSYGASKLAGERYVQMLLDRFYIVRLSWLFAPLGNNFPQKIIKLAKQKGALSVVTDEIANPTYAPDLAQAIVQLIETNHFGIYHLTNEGSVSRYNFAARILQLAGLAHIPLTPISLADYERDSTPPANGALANFAAATVLGIKLRPWQEALEEFFKSNV